MDIAAISSQLASRGARQTCDAKTGDSHDPAKIAKVSRQFESILLRQILGESMKPLLKSGPSGQVYGYMLTDSLAKKSARVAGSGWPMSYRRRSVKDTNDR